MPLVPRFPPQIHSSQEGDLAVNDLKLGVIGDQPGVEGLVELDLGAFDQVLADVLGLNEALGQPGGGQAAVGEGAPEIIEDQAHGNILGAGAK